MFFNSSPLVTIKVSSKYFFANLIAPALPKGSSSLIYVIETDESTKKLDIWKQRKT